MNRFEIAALKIEKEYGVSCEWNSQNISHKYIVEGQGALNIKDARKKAKFIYNAALNTYGSYQ